MNEELFEDEVYTMTDEDGNEVDFTLAGSCEVDGNTYFAVIPMDEENDSEEVQYTILKKEVDENGEEMFVTIDDDEEFDKIADIFEDELFSDADYDEGQGE